MSTFFSTARESANIEATLYPPLTEEEEPAGAPLFNDHTLEGLGRSFMRGSASTLAAAAGGVRTSARVLGALAALPERRTPRTYLSPSQTALEAIGDALSQTDPGFWDGIVRETTRGRREFLDYRATLAPDPRQTSLAESVLGGLIETSLPAAVGHIVAGPPGASALTGATFADMTNQDLLAEGVDAETARNAAFIEGASMAALVALPVARPSRAATLPLRLAERASTGVGISVITGGVYRGGMEAYLRSRGYEEQAARYQWNDAQALAADAILGAAFGAVFGARALPRPVREGETPPSPQQVAAAMVTRDRIHRDIETAPGVPLTDDARALHADSLATAARQAAAGEEINVGAIWEGTDLDGFAPPPDDVAMTASEIEYAARAERDVPQTLSQWARARGGLRDEGEEISGLIGATEGRDSGRFVRAHNLYSETGQPLDDTALAAWEAGFFPNHADRPTIREFLDAIASDLRGERVVADERADYEARNARDVLRTYEQRGVNTALRGEALRADIRRHMAAQEAAFDEVMGEFFVEQGMPDLTARVDRLREEVRARGAEIDEWEALYSRRERVGFDALRAELRNQALPVPDAWPDMPIANIRLGDLPAIRPLGPDEAAEVAQYAARGTQAPPIIIRRDGDQIRIVDGHRRVMAARRSGRDEIQAYDASRLFSRDPARSGESDLLASMGRETYFSAVVRLLEETRQASAPGDQWWAMISKAPGVKREELEWIGLEDWLKAQEGQVAREDVLAFVRANGVQVEETVLGGEIDQARSQDIQRRLLPLIEERSRLEQWQANHSARVHSDGAIITEADAQQYRDNAQRLAEIRAQMIPIEQEQAQLTGGNRTRWSQYALPGGQNYREVLLRLPENLMREDSRQAVEEAAQAIRVARRNNAGMAEINRLVAEWEAIRRRPDVQRAQRQYFRSSHFDQPNVLCHVRFNERTDANGKRTLFIEEVQSDWHQAGRERGYKGDAEIQRIEAKLRDAGLDQSVIDTLKTSQSAPPETYETILNTLTQEELARLRAETGSQRVPDAPFKNNAWASLALKRMIRWAAENGFDQIAWTPGQVQVERFNLAKFIDELRLSPREVNKGDGARHLQALKNGNVVFDRLIKRGEGDQLSDIVGAELAARLEAAPEATMPDRGDYAPTRSLSGIDLKTGGEGMRAFYDRILVNIANDLAKKYGARVGETQIGGINEGREAYVSGGRWLISENMMRSGASRVQGTPAFQSKADAETWIKDHTETVHTLPITPEMRARALNEGLPLFSNGDGAGRGVSAADLRADLSRAFGGAADKLIEAGRIEIVESAADLRTLLREAGLERFADAVRGDSRGYYLRGLGKAFIVAENVSLGEARGIVLHEIGVHHGLADMLGARGFTALTRQMDMLVSGKHPLALRARERAEADARGRAERGEANPDRFVAEETIAYLVETAPDLPPIRRLLATIRQWLWRAFPELVNLTADDVRALAVVSLRRAARQAEREVDETRALDTREARESEMLSAARREGYQGTDTGEAREWLDARAKGLPMDEASRMQRAREMGFDVDTPLYRGRRGDYSAFNLSRLQTGTNRPMNGKPGVPEDAIFFDESPSVASAYVRPYHGVPGERHNYLEGANILPAYARGNFKTVNMRQRDYDTLRERDPEGLRRLLEEARGEGFDGVRFENLRDLGSKHRGSTQVAVFDPSNIRSRFAAFDPARSGESDLLASRWDDSAPTERRTSGWAIRGRSDAPPSAPDFGTPEWAAAAFEARAKQGRGERLTPIERWVLANDEGAEGLFSFGGARAPDTAFHAQEPVDQALAEDPEMRLARADGDERAADALARVRAEAEDAPTLAKGVDAVINCAIRHGGNS